EAYMANQPNLDENLIWIANAALERQLFEQAGDLYQLILRRWPDTPKGITAQTGLITAAMHQMDFSRVEQHYQQLLNRFGGHPRIADKVNEVAHLYERFKMSTKSRDLYRYVSDTWPMKGYAAKALKEEIRLNILLRDRAAYDAALAKAQGPMAANKGIAKAVMGAADYCFKKKYYDYAKELYQVVIDAWPQSAYVCTARAKLICRMIGEGDLDGAATAVENLQSTFAQDAHLAEALRSIAGEYRSKARHDLALALYDTIIAQPDVSSKTLTNTYRSRLMACMEMGDAAAVTATADRFRSAYPDKDQSLSIAQVAASAWKKGLAEAAVGLSNDVLAHNPADEQAAILARRLVILGTFMDGDTAQAEGQIASLINDYAGSKYLPGALKVLGDAYRSTVDKPRALRLYQLAATMAPTSKSGKQARKAWLKLNVELGATEEALAEAEALLTDDVTGGGAVEQVYRLAAACEAQGQYAQAETLYRQVMAAQEMGSQRIHAQAHLAALLDYQGEKEEAATLLTDLVQAHYNAPDFPKTLLMIAERSYKAYLKIRDEKESYSRAQKNLEKSILILDILCNQAPEDRITIDGLMYLADGYYEKGLFEYALAYYQRAITDYPDFEYIWHAQYREGMCYSHMMIEGTMEEDLAFHGAMAAFQDVMVKYPTCPAAKSSKKWLEKISTIYLYCYNKA
ncbi:MAG: tetratricopeptide repeat protein, partial [Sedimentisphaerales bacterium]|nr:tetratricopeptide repeat protein [Sedimentisphaerales bacterium]